MMKCQQCIAENKRSTLYAPMGGLSTDMGWRAFYDEDGVYHSHNPNSITEEWSCSNGHRWHETTFRPCPADGCDWRGGYQRSLEARQTAQKPPPPPTTPGSLNPLNSAVRAS